MTFYVLMNVALVFVVYIFKILIPTLYTIVRDCLEVSMGFGNLKALL